MQIDFVGGCFLVPVHTTFVLPSSPLSFSVLCGGWRTVKILIASFILKPTRWRRRRCRYTSNNHNRECQVRIYLHFTFIYDFWLMLDECLCLPHCTASLRAHTHTHTNRCVQAHSVVDAFHAESEFVRTNSSPFSVLKIRETAFGRG